MRALARATIRQGVKRRAPAKNGLHQTSRQANVAETGLERPLRNVSSLRRSMDSKAPTPPTVLTTARLRLRHWRASDRAPFALLNAKLAVMEYLPGALSQVENDALIDRIEAHFARHGFGLWAVEIPNVTPFAGFMGLTVPRFDAHFTPCVEIGWRLDEPYWGHGYATEGARAVATFGFDVLQLDEILSFTVPSNARSRRVMEKIGMTHTSVDDFDHPAFPPGHRLRRHVLYRLDGGALHNSGLQQTLPSLRSGPAR